MHPYLYEIRCRPRNREPKMEVNLTARTDTNILSHLGMIVNVYL